MPSRLRRAAWVLAAAFVASRVPPAEAQLLRWLSGSHASPATAKPGETLPAATARLQEIQVELAWLADSNTFGCALTARVHGKEIELSGAVPSETVKTHALQTAKTATVLTLKDALKVQPGLAVRQASAVGTSGLSEPAAKLLIKGFGEHAAGFEILDMGEGHMVLNGKVGSYEEKLAVSRYLRQLPGCTHVGNQLEVTPVAVQGKQVMRVTADGKLTVIAPAHPTPAPKTPPPGGSTQLTPVPQTKPPAGPTQVASVSPYQRGSIGANTQTLPRLPAPKTSTAPPNLPDGVVKSSTGGLLTHLGNSEGSAAKCPGKSCALASDDKGSGKDAKDAKTPTAEKSKTIVPAGWKETGESGVVTATVGGSSSPTPQDTVPCQCMTEATVTPVKSRGLLGFLWPSKKRDKAETVVFVTSTTPAPGVIRETRSNAPVITSVSPPLTPVAAVNMTPSRSEPPRIMPVAQMKEVPGGALPLEPYVANGIVFFEDTAALGSDPGMAPATVQAQFRYRVAALCGQQARNVDVVVGADNVVVVKVSLNSAASEKQLRDKLMHLPEMQSAGVRLQFTTVQ